VDDTAMKRTWPFVNNYSNFCNSCKLEFLGPKRAPVCWVCLNGPSKKVWLDQQAIVIKL